MRFSKTSLDDTERLVEIVQEAYRSMGITIHPQSNMMGYIRGTEQYLEVKKSGVDFSQWSWERYRGMMKKVLKLQIVGTALQWAIDKPKVSPIMRRLLKGEIDLTKKEESVAKTACFELKTLEMFEAAGIPAFFQEPDVVFELNDQQFSVACKCVFSESKVEMRVRKAKKQIAKRERKGFIALSIDNITRMREMLVCQDQAEFSRLVSDATSGFVQRHEKDFARWLGKDKKQLVCLSPCKHLLL